MNVNKTRATWAVIVIHEKFGIKGKKYSIPNNIGNISGEKYPSCT